jgi:hypothetical protein
MDRQYEMTVFLTTCYINSRLNVLKKYFKVYGKMDCKSGQCLKTSVIS